MPNTADKIKGSMLGLAVGDALGAPYEFRTPAEPIRNYREGGHHGIRKGEWTDDTSMALCLAISLINKSGQDIFDIKHQLRLYEKWLNHGYMSTRDESFGSGRTTRNAIAAFLETGEIPTEPLADERAGNGSIMRLAPVPLAYSFDIAKAAEYSAESSKSTHRLPECVQACALMGQIIAQAVQGFPKDEVLFPKEGFYNLTEQKVIDLSKGLYLEEELPTEQQTGYVIDTLKIALWCVAKTESFEDAIIAAVNVPGDRDTYGAVTGQIAGAIYGVQGIPARWLEDLMKRELIENVANLLFDVRRILEQWAKLDEMRIIFDKIKETEV